MHSQALPSVLVRVITVINNIKMKIAILTLRYQEETPTTTHMCNRPLLISSLIGVQPLPMSMEVATIWAGSQQTRMTITTTTTTEVPHIMKTIMEAYMITINNSILRPQLMEEHRKTTVIIINSINSRVHIKNLHLTQLQISQQILRHNLT